MPFSNAQHRMSPAAANCFASCGGLVFNASNMLGDVGKDQIGSLF